MHPAGALHVTELVVVRPPEALASFLDERRYLPKGVPMLKRILALPGQTVCRSDRTITVDGIAMGEALDHDRSGRALPVLARLPRRCGWRSLPDELAVGGLPRWPLFWPAACQHHRRPGRSSLDARGGLTMPERPQLDRGPRARSLPSPSSFPAMFDVRCAHVRQNSPLAATCRRPRPCDCGDARLQQSARRACDRAACRRLSLPVRRSPPSSPRPRSASAFRRRGYAP